MLDSYSKLLLKNEGVTCTTPIYIYIYYSKMRGGAPLIPLPGQPSIKAIQAADGKNLMVSLTQVTEDREKMGSMRTDRGENRVGRYVKFFVKLFFDGGIIW